MPLYKIYHCVRCYAFLYHSHCSLHLRSTSVSLQNTCTNDQEEINTVMVAVVVSLSVVLILYDYLFSSLAMHSTLSVGVLALILYLSPAARAVIFPFRNPADPEPTEEEYE